MPLPQRLHRLAAELQACAGRRPEPRAVRAAGGQALLEKQELWDEGVVFGKPLVNADPKDTAGGEMLTAVLTRPEK